MLDDILRIAFFIAAAGLAASTVWLGMNNLTGAAGVTAALSLGFCVFVFLTRFKRFKALGFEGELWEQEMEGAAKLRLALRDLSERVGDVYWQLGVGRALPAATLKRSLAS